MQLLSVSQSSDRCIMKMVKCGYLSLEQNCHVKKYYSSCVCGFHVCA